ncbi:hypothetical protein VTN00DRAFT_4684 [Thermoascus crustaceus]|uniref:uncharacterized protein n=1 Tax=Thermoascus crustaceus TaxID=5088 RepID=UPI00374294E4
MAPLLFLIPYLLSPAIATTSTLYASHYNGNVYSLSLESNDNNGSGNYSLSLASSLRTCGSMPSWLTFDASDRTLYCSDEPSDENSNSGTLTALSADQDGKLTEVAKASTVVGGVSSVIYNGANGVKHIAIAHYQGSALSTYALPLKPNAPAIQTFTYTLPKPGPDAARQDAPHPHQVFLDPTGSFLLSPDLGSDVVRVYAIDTSGRLNECSGISVTPGNGPRHGVFWNPDSSLDEDKSSRSKRSSFQSQLPPRRGGNPKYVENSIESTMLYIVTELGNTVSAYSVSYNNATCLSFNETQSLSPYPDGKGVPNGANVAEVRAQDHFLYVSVRSDHAFPPNDSLATLSLSEEQTVEFQRLTSSYGTVPRTLVINKGGDLVAVGNQASSDVVIIRRDTKTGELGEEVARLNVGEPGTPGTATGLSSVIWGE